MGNILDDTSKLKKALRNSSKWLLDSGIQEMSEGNEKNGGVHAWYQEPEQSFSFLYTEITGYALSAFVQLYESTKDKFFLTRAIQAGDWLLDHAQVRDGSKFEGAFIHRFESQGESNSGITYTFDNAICLNGLIDLYSS